MTRPSRVAAVAVAVPIVLGAIAVSRADAADISARVAAPITLDSTGVTRDPASGLPLYWDWQKVELSMAWTLPAGAKTGDIFYASMDPNLRSNSFDPFALVGADGVVYARSRNIGKSITFTLERDLPTAVSGRTRFAMNFEWGRIGLTGLTPLTIHGSRIVARREANPVARLDVEKFVGPWAGVTFVGGVPQLDAIGQPVALPAGDHDTSPGLTVTPGQSVTITIRVTNTGTEELDNIVVSDSTLAGPAASAPVCTYRGSTVMPFNAMMPGESFTCTQQLAPFTGAHSNRVTASSGGKDTGNPANDSDGFFATAVSTTPTPVPEPGPNTPQGNTGSGTSGSGTAGTPAATTPTATPTVSPTATPATPTPTPAPAPTPPPPAAQQVGAPALAITKTAVARLVTAGGTASWRVVVRNTGDAAATSVVVCDTPQRQLVFRERSVRYVVNGTAGQAPVTVAGGRACFTVDRLPAGGTLSVALRTRVATTGRGTLTNVATARASGVAIVRDDATVAVPTPRPRPTSPAVTG